ncbi:hypothetical protein ACQKWADRAFT_82194 [Trichoderma austrokoningii]
MKLARERARQDPSINEVILFLDNSAVVDGILGQTPHSSQSAYMGLRRIARELLPGIHTRVAWVPGHKDIPGNEAADKLAKEGSELPTPPSRTATITHIKRWARSERNRLRELDWDQNQPPYYGRWRLDALPKPPELQLPRTILHRLYAERTGHGDFVEYHERFGHDARPACKCGEPRTQGHFVVCRMVQPFLPEVPEKDLLAGVTPLGYLLGPNGHKDFQKLVEDMDPYGPAPQTID